VTRKQGRNKPTATDRQIKKFKNSKKIEKANRLHRQDKTTQQLRRREKKQQTKENKQIYALLTNNL